MAHGFESIPAGTAGARRLFAADSDLFISEISITETKMSLSAAGSREPLARTDLVFTHETAITDYIGCQDCRKPSLDALLAKY